MKTNFLPMIIAVVLGAFGCSTEKVEPEIQESFSLEVDGQKTSISDYTNYSGGGVVTIEAQLPDGGNLFMRIITKTGKTYVINQNSESFILYANSAQVEFTSRSAGSAATLNIDSINYGASWLSGSITDITLAGGGGQQVALNECRFTRISFKVNERIAEGFVKMKVAGSSWEADRINPTGPTGYLAFFADRSSDGSQIRLMLRPTRRREPINYRSPAVPQSSFPKTVLCSPGVVISRSQSMI